MSQPISYKSLVDVGINAELLSSDTILIEQKGCFKRIPASIITDLVSRFIVNDNGEVCLNGVVIPDVDVQTEEITAAEVAAMFESSRNTESTDA